MGGHTKAVAAGAAILAVGFMAGPGSVPGQAASHVEAPLTSSDPQIDGTDLYAFTSPDRPDTVTLIANYHPLEIPGTLHTWTQNTRYEIHIDQQGTGKADLTYRWTFTGAFNPQRYKLEKFRPGQPAEVLVSEAKSLPLPAGAGELTPSYRRDGAVVDLPGGGKVATGQSADPFFFNLKTLALIKFGTSVSFLNFNPLFLFNVSATVLQLPKTELALNGDVTRNPVIGVWATATKQTSTLDGKPGGWVQVSRMGNPFFNESITTPSMKDRFNATSPFEDKKTGMVDATIDPKIVPLIEGVGVKGPKPPRTDLHEIFLTGFTRQFDGPIKDELNSQVMNKDARTEDFFPCDELRLNMTTPITPKPRVLGYLAGDKQGWPNGRRLGDEVGNPFLRMLLGEPVTIGSPGIVDQNDWIKPPRPFRASFPYLARPIGL